MKLFALLSLFAAGLRATQITPMPWEQLAHEAAFVGVVECTAAGGVVARYVVLESWKGPPEGTELFIKTPGDYWHGQLPLALVGERFFMTAYENPPRPEIKSVTLGGAVPLWSRRIPHQYALPLFQGRLRLPRPTSSSVVPPSFQHWEESQGGLFDTGAKTWPQFKKIFTGFLSLPAPERERRVAKIRVGGRRGVPAPVIAPSAPEPPPSEQRLAELRGVLGGAIAERGWQEAFEILTVHDPGTAAAFLVRWTDPTPEQVDFSLPYALGSYFGQNCGGDRKKHLETLLGARDPFVRVAGAVYLAFEDPRAGEAALRSWMSLPGDAGVWAALTLARRGERAAVPRALEVFAMDPPRGSIASAAHFNLTDQVMVLLSNSAFSSGLELPACEPGGCTSEVDSRLEGKELKEWWRKHGERLTPYDPWRDVLARQKVD